MKDKKIETVGTATPEQIEEWKKEHDNLVYGIIVKGDGKNHAGYIKKPNLELMAAAAEGGGDNNIRTAVLMLELVWLGGDPQILKNEELKASAMKQVSTLFKIRESEIKKL